jgi:hypothetical protein
MSGELNTVRNANSWRAKIKMLDEDELKDRIDGLASARPIYRVGPFEA